MGEYMFYTTPGILLSKYCKFPSFAKFIKNNLRRVFKRHFKQKDIFFKKK